MHVQGQFFDDINPVVAAWKEPKEPFGQTARQTPMQAFRASLRGGLGPRSSDCNALQHVWHDDVQTYPVAAFAHALFTEHPNASGTSAAQQMP